MDPVQLGRPQYVGQTSRMISSRFNEHGNAVKTGSTTVGSHFKAQGHNLQDLECITNKKVRSTFLPPYLK